MILKKKRVSIVVAKQATKKVAKIKVKKATKTIADKQKNKAAIKNVKKVTIKEAAKITLNDSAKEALNEYYPLFISLYGEKTKALAAKQTDKILSNKKETSVKVLRVTEKVTVKNEAQERSKRLKRSLFAETPGLSEPFPGFNEHVPKWGATIQLNGRRVNVTNTCSIDYLLFGFWIASKRRNFLRDIPELEKTEALRRVISYIDALRWDKGREIWIDSIMRVSHGQSRGSLSLFGAQFDQFLQFINEYQQFEKLQTCTESCTRNNRSVIRTDIFFYQTESGIKHSFEMPYDQICNVCLNLRSVTMRFLNDPNFIFIQPNGFNYLNDIPKRINIDNIDFQLVCATLHNIEIQHFYGVFNIDDNFYVVDDLDQSVAFLENILRKNIYLTMPVSTCMYVKV